MRARRVPTSTNVFRLAGGNEDNDLWVERAVDSTGTQPVLLSVWEPSEEERAALAEGATIELCVWGESTPPVSIAVGASLEERRG